MQVTLGLKYDGPVPAPFENNMGAITVGPVGLLRVLENQLGIPGEESSFTTRLIQYLAALDESQYQNAFYAESYDSDPFSVARTLLQWRDQWYLAGWNGSFPKDVPARLTDMTALEQHAGSVDQGLGQRLQHVITLLAENPVAIESIELRDEITDFPYLWRELINAIGVPVTTIDKLVPQAPKTTDLGKLQQHLLSQSNQSAVEKISLLNDGTLTVLGAHSANETTPLVAYLSQRWLTQEPDQSVAILAEQRGDLLDEAMEAAGAPRLGFTALSPWRPIFQILPLVCELLWEPLNPTALFQFLSHPVGPVPARVRQKLAQVVREIPGIGSLEWQRMLAQCLDDEEATNGSVSRDKLQQRIEYWVESPRVSPQVGIDSKRLRERAKRVADWLVGLLESSNDESLQALYHVALNQVQEFEHAVERLHDFGRDSLTRDNVLRLIEDVRGNGAPITDRHAEVIPGFSLALRAEHSGSFNSPVDALIWWDCQASDRVHRWPFSQTERKALTANGVQLQSEAEQLEWLGKAWLRPLLCTKQHCTIVSHHDVERQHPLWEQISSITEGLHTLPASEPSTAEILGIPLQPLEHRTLPGKSRWWQLDEKIKLDKREFESFSSLDAFINSPYQWLLNYAARIRPGSLGTIKDGNLLKGNIAHRLYEEFFNAHPKIAQIKISEVAGWVDENILSLLEKEGALLLEAGRQAECEQLITQLQYSLEVLTTHLQQAHVETVKTELKQEGMYYGGKLTGSIDLLATRSDGSEAVVDIKWGGRNYRRDSMRANSYLQLATYAQLRQNKNGDDSPKLGYFIVTDAHLLSLNHDFFPEAEQITPTAEENWQEFWQRFEYSWKWRRKQFDGGLIEVTVTNTLPTESSQPGDRGLDIPDESDTFSDYSVLTGWDDNA